MFEGWHGATRLGLVPALAILLFGCQVDIDFDGAQTRCDREPFTCPAGLECRSGACLSPLATDAASDGALVDGPAGIVIPSFAAPTIITELSDPAAQDDDASFSADRLYVVLNSNRTGTSSLFTSSRASIDASWSAPVLDSVLSSAEDDTTTALSADGLSLMFGSRRPGGIGALDIYLSTRASRQAAWAPPINVSSLNTTGGDAAGWIANDLSEVLIHSRRGGTNAIYSATLDSGTTFNTPVLIAEVTSGVESEFSGRFARDGLVLTFHSNRPSGIGDGDLYASTRESASDPFGPPRLIEGLNSTELDEDAWLSDDLCYIAFASEVGGNREIFEARCE